MPLLKELGSLKACCYKRGAPTELLSARSHPHALRCLFVAQTVCVRSNAQFQPAQNCGTISNKLDYRIAFIPTVHIMSGLTS